jgi:hypothetical protein
LLSSSSVDDEDDDENRARFCDKELRQLVGSAVRSMSRAIGRFNGHSVPACAALPKLFSFVLSKKGIHNQVPHSLHCDYLSPFELSITFLQEPSLFPPIVLFHQKLLCCKQIKSHASE